jgi:hypothetical protein
MAGLAALAGLGGPLGAQSRTAGRIVRVAAGDTLAVPRVAVVLHRVGRAAQGPVDTVAADGAGRFAFRFAADSNATYLLSVRYDGIEYFSSPIATNPARPDTAVVVIVADTSSSAPVSARERTLLISRPDAARSRAVVDWFVLVNAGERTRIAPDSLRPSWAAPLPPDAQNVELADLRLSQFSPEALSFRGDSALVFAPLSPGQKELVLQYQVPGALRRFVVPGAAGTDSIFVLLEEARARVVVPAMTVGDSQRLDGRLFRRWAGRMGAATAIEVEFPGAPLAPRTALLLLLGAAGLGFALLAGLALRRRRIPAPIVDPVFLADAIARLDLAQQDAGEQPPEARAAYLAERERLKQALQRALAATRGRS